MSAFSHFAHYDARRRALCFIRPSSSNPLSFLNDFSTEILGFITKDNRFSLFAHVNNGRWQCHHSYGFIILHQRVFPASLTFRFDSSIDYRTLVYCYRISVYRPRRKRGRIKCEVEKRHSLVGEQKIDERAGDVLRFGFYGDKNSLSTLNVTNCLLSTRNPPPPHSTFMQAKRLRLTTADTPQLSSTVVIPEGRNESRSSLIPYVGELDAAAASQSARRTQRHDDLATMSNTRCQGTTGRYGSWIQRSPTHNQRESSNAKFHCQWHERVVVFCFGVLTCAMFTLLITKPTTHISLGNKTHSIEEFLLFYHPFRFSFSFPAPKQASPTSSRRSRPTIARKLVKDNNCAKGRPNYLGRRRCFKEQDVISFSSFYFFAFL